MYIHIELVPVRVKTLAGFSARDPWNELAPAEFTIEAHLLAPKNSWRLRAPRDTGGPYVLGIRSELDGETHWMPESLSELWNTGKAPADALPRLLYRVEFRLKKADFRFDLHAKLHLWVLGVCCALTLAACLWTAFAFITAPPPPDARLQRAPAVYFPPQEWLQSPMQEKQPVTMNVPALEGRRQLSEPVRVPPNFLGARPDTLAWVKAAEGRRLLLMSAADARRPGSSAGFGFALRRSDLSLPGPLLDQLRMSMPDLNTDLIMCFGWVYFPGEPFSPWFGITLAAIPLATGLLVFAVGRRRQLKRGRQMEEFLASLGERA